MPNEIPLNHKLVSARKLRGWDQVYMASRANISRVYLSYFETGKALPTDDQLSKIEAALGIRFNDPAIEAAFAVLSGTDAPAGIEARRVE